MTPIPDDYQPTPLVASLTKREAQWLADTSLATAQRLRRENSRLRGQQLTDANGDPEPPLPITTP
ncbi:hypothetical protein GCM10027591_03750 [Zhihengliuella somnathii]